MFRCLRSLTHSTTRLRRPSRCNLIAGTCADEEDEDGEKEEKIFVLPLLSGCGIFFLFLTHNVTVFVITFLQDPKVG
jgi:hypothetical protein